MFRGKTVLIGSGSDIDHFLAKNIAEAALDANIRLVYPEEMINHKGSMEHMLLDDLDKRHEEIEYIRYQKAPELKTFGPEPKPTCKKHHEYIHQDSKWKCRFCHITL